MSNLVLSQIVQTGRTVTTEHFGGNAVYTRNTNEGNPDTSFIEAAHQLDIQTLRYPAGQPDVAYVDGLLINGELPDHLVSFMESAKQENFRVLIVTPTIEGYRGPDELYEFIKQLMLSYGGQIHAFEVGNENWNFHGEMEYGRVADESVLAINAALEDINANVDIWVQMANAGGLMSDYRGVEGGWIHRSIDANRAIIAELSDEARAAIDGVAEHYYYRNDAQIIGDIPDSEQLIQLEHQIWENAFGNDLSLNLTEWNIRTTNLSQLGMRAASTMLAQFEFMIEVEVDEAYVWPPQHNTSSDLAGGDDVLYDPLTGIVINSVGGAIFDLMSSSLVGLELVETRTKGSSSNLMEHVYAGEDQVVVYVSSRSNETEQVTFSLGDFWPGSQLVTAIQIGYDQSTSDGMHYDYVNKKWISSVSVKIDDRDYFINEHDVQASITQHDVNQNETMGGFGFELRPYEVIELTYNLPDGPVVGGTSGNDKLLGSDESELIFGFGGADVISAGMGSDTIAGGEGNDFINSGAGRDLVNGGLGSDTLRGWGGNDTLSGDDDSDVLYGWHGHDLLKGGEGDDTLDGGYHADTLMGGEGEDLLYGGNGYDWLYGDSGNDTIFAGESADRIFGGDGNDEIHAGSNFGYTFDGAYGEAGEDTIYGGAGFDNLSGGDGDDVLYGGHQADNLFGDAGNDLLIGDQGLDRLFGGIGNDLLDGGVGNDGHFGGEGSDTVFCGEGNDRVFGGKGDDVAHGGSGKDTIYGGAGFDTIIGGEGDDVLYGNFNADTFVFDANHGHDTVGDFAGANFFERIDLAELAVFRNWNDIVGRLSQIGSDVLIETGQDSSIRLVGVGLSELDMGDFII